MKYFLKIRARLLTVIIGLMLTVSLAQAAATYYSRATGNWTANTTWSLTSGGVAVGAGVYPVAGDAVFIEGGFTVTVDATSACTSIQFGHTGATASAGSLTFSNSSTLTVSGAVLVGNNVSGSSGTITFTSGSTLIAGSLRLGGTTGNANGTITMTAGGTLSLGGAITLGSGTRTWTPGTGTVKFTATNTLPSTIFTTFNNLEINGGTTTTAVNLTAIAALTIGSSGTFTTAAAHTITATNITVNGTYTNGSTGALTVTNWVVGSTGIYNHTSTSAILPKGSTSTIWDAASNLNITRAFTSATVITNFIGQTFGNVTFNPSSMTNTVCLFGASGSVTVNNFTVSSTGSSTLYMRQSGQQFVGVLNINGSLTISAGIFDMHNGGATPTISAINLKGNFTLSGTSSLTQTTTQTGSTVNFNFIGTGTQTVAISSSAFITSQATTASCAIQFTVASGATVDLGNSVLKGTNNTSFTLSAGTGIITANTEGLSASGATGSIQVTGPRTYSPTANYTYNSLVAGQVTGNGVTKANNLNISNINAGVTFSNAIAVSGNMSVASSAHANLGTFISTAASLTLGGTNQTNGLSYGGTGAPAGVIINSTFFNNNTGQLNVALAAPSNLSYSSPYSFPVGVSITPQYPTVTGSVTSYAIVPSLSTGLAFDTSTGAITGTPAASPSANYVVTATNTAGTTTCTVVISVGDYRYAVADAAWDLATTWAATSGGTAGASVPVSGTIVFIGEASARTVTIPAGVAAVCGNLTMGNYSAATAATLTMAGAGSSLSVGHDLVMNRPNATATSAINVNVGTLTVEGQLMLANSDLTPNASATLINQVNITTGTVTTRDLMFNGQAAAQSAVVFSGAGTLNISGDLTFGYILGTLTPSTGTVNFTGAAQTVPYISSVTYNNLGLSGSGTKTLSAAMTSVNNLTLSGTASASTLANLAVGGTLTVGTGTTLTTGTNFTLGVTGATSVTGTLTLAGTGDKTFTGDVTVNTGGVWNETGIAAINYAGSLANNGTTFTALSGVHTFSGTSKTISGTSEISIANVALTGTYTNSGTLTVSTALSGAGGLTNGNGSTGTLNLGGTSAITTFSAALAGNTVNYTGAGQTLRVTAYHHLKLSGGAETFGTITTVAGNLTLSGAATATTGANLAIGGILDIGTGTTFTTGADFTLGVTGATSVTGTLSLANTGAKTFTGNVTVNAGGVWNETGIASINFAGNLQHDGTTFTANTGTHTFSGTTKTISGASTISIPNVAVTGTYTNINTLTVSTALSGAGSLTNGNSTTGTLNLGGSSAITTFDASPTNNLVNYTGAAQTAKVATYYNLTLSGSLAKTFATTPTVNGTLSMEGTASVIVTAGVVTYGAAATLQYKGSGAQITGAEFPATWTGTGGVKIENTSGVTLNAIKTFTSPAPLNIGSSIANSLFSDGGFQITATDGIFHLTSGTFKLGSGASATTFPGFATITNDAGTTVEYAATATQSVKGITYSNLTISGTGTNSKIADYDITVDGILNLNSTNASVTQGCLSMSTFTLNMGASATTTGTGDVTGIVRRASFALNTPYTFGNQFTTLTITAGKLPSWVSAKIVLPGTALFPNAITRYYDFSQSGGNATTLVTLNLHYLPGTYPSGEFTGTASLSNLDVYDWDVGGSQEDKGHSNGSTTDLWLGLANQTLDYITPTGAFGTKYWTLGARSLIDYTWLGFTDNTWATTTNWVGGNVPGPGNHAIIPDATGTNNDPTLPATTTIGSITINLGGILNGGTGTVLSLDGTTNAWENLAGVSGFVAGTSTVKFTAAGATMADPTNFYNVDVATGASLTLGTNNIMRIAGALTLTGTGVLNAASNHNTVEYNGTAQTVVNPNGSTTGYHNLILSGSYAKTMPGTSMTVYGDLETAGSAAATAGNAITVAGNVILGSGTAFDAATFSHTVSGNWTNNGTTETPGTGTVTFNSTSATQAINGSASIQTFYNLVIDKTTQTLSVGGSTTTLTVNNLTETSGNFTAPASLNVNGNATLTAGTFTGGATTTITGNATLTAGTFIAGATTNITGNATLTAGTFTAGAATNIAGNWSRAIASTFSNSGGTVTFNGSSAQTIGGTASTTFHNLTINNNAGATSTIDQYVNGVLNLQSANPSAAKGSLSMPDPFKLYMGASATTTGPGDVSGYITRTSFALGTPYTFGSQYTLMNFAVGPLPSSVTLEVYLANPSTWKSNAINRYYDVTQIGGTADTRLRFNAHYLNSELNSNTDGNLDLFDHHVLGTYAGQTHDHGRTDFSNASNAEWVGFSNVGLVFLGVDTPDDHLWTLGNNTTGSTSTWIGGSPSGPTDWNLPGNWEGGVPLATSDVHIPAAAYAPVLPDGSTTILSAEIQSGGILNASNGTPALNITGGTDAWLSSGTFNAGNSTVTFTNAAATIGGTTGFNNITVETGAKLTPGAGSTMIIGGTFTRTGTFDAYTNSNTVEYNGTGQTVINPNGTSPGYQNLVLSGSGSKTLPAETMLVQGSFTLSGSATATVNNPVTVTGMTTISGTSNLILGSTGTDKLSNTGAITLNGGTFTAGYTETVGTLNLSDNSSIALGTGNHTLTFAASNGVSWTEGKMITISGWTGTIVGSGNEGKISVSSATGLTANQLSQVKFYIGSTYNNSTILGSEVVPTATWTWTGTTSSDWSVIGNWSSLGGGVPPSGADIVIADVTNNPIVSTAVLFNNLAINSGGLLTITSSGAVTVNGTLTVTGTDALIVNSDEFSNGSLIVLGSSTGEITYNRYMLGGRWYIVSSPVNIISQSIGSWLPLSGVSIANGVYGMTTYKESTNTWDSYYTASASDGFVAGQGYLMRKDANGTISFTGTLNADPVSTTIGRTTTGWNSVGNPFTSPISGNRGTASIENFITKNIGELDPSHIAIYYWDESGGYSGASYKIINNTGAAAYLQAGQGFLVKSKYGGVSLTFSNSMCYAQNSQVLRSVTVSSWSSLVLQAASVGKTKTTTIDFRSDMTTGLDPTYDAGIYKSDPNFELYTRLVDDNGIDFAIQCLPTDVWKTLSIPVGIDLPLGGEVIFSLSSMDIPTGYYPLLTDKLLNTSTYLKTTADNYTVTLPANTSGAGRFYITFGEGSATGTELPLNSDMSSLKVYPNPASDIINVQIEGYSGAVTLQIVDMQGIIVREFRNEVADKGRQKFEIPVNTLSKGLYMVNAIYTDGKRKTERVIIGR